MAWPSFGLSRNLFSRPLDAFIGLVAIFALGLLLLENCEYLQAYSTLISRLNLIVLLIFMGDVIWRFAASPNKAAHLKSNWFDLIVFVPLVQYVRGLDATPFFIVARQVVIITMLISRTRRANKLIAMLSFRPAQLMLTSFAFAIAFGAVLLMLPAATVSGVRLSLVDALFTATSAVCVTGLIVKDTATYFSPFGQLVILALVQIGGLGIMTFSVTLALLLRKSFGVKEQFEMQEVLDQDVISNVKNLVMFIFKMTFILEIAGALVLFLLWRDRFNGGLTALYHAVFHSVSAFCNAGFSTFSDSLMRFSDDLWTNLTIMLLVVLGGLGFIVIRDFYHNLRNKFGRNRDITMKLRVQTRLVLYVSMLLIAIGTLLIFFMERKLAFAGLRFDQRLLVSLFQSITTRTAGFNTVDIVRLSAPTLFFMLIFMFIGASPGSTGGGIKTTTIAVFWATIVSAFRQREQVQIFKRTIPFEIIQKAVLLFGAAIMLVMTFILVLLYTEQKPLLDVAFETVSAFGTVGLSTGLTPLLSSKGKIVITLLMFIGRLGPLTIGYAFAGRHRPANITYAEERVMIG